MPTLGYYKYIIFYIFAGDVLQEKPHLHFAKSKNYKNAG
jgi:hypothetical protein